MNVRRASVWDSGRSVQTAAVPGGGWRGSGMWHILPKGSKRCPTQRTGMEQVMAMTLTDT
ncbi:hypothetical protein [Paenibacillus popilliae]|uniref:hypothetical protein n=1 Tax=Paenibacillus popilliae TaxID=78057 RepID=UPI0011D2B4E4|nr:hypothetical protein [Paenibacillus popilliae]